MGSAIVKQLDLGDVQAASPALVLQIAQSRLHLRTLGPEVGSVYILGALGQCNHENSIEQSLL